ncbi:sigma-70 family RNA polymerase sigma factor [Janthinobacterium sp. 1_2014MBL_MicDiv]|uniref:sigma-70 family RNA polymerase sigma factor n=1 Tax=Janthinobacterium sp. 1_2014MBL_MicDiv TaxID=1644131 RepID=UPI0008F4AB2B|nr:sigma-70 family RNA polymerase sigma factor [Janthinobacterium sp. 1_2014MBL_MicDiv]APA67099.1 RNA polymerase sigma factor [Janthinobacterium sp. 1_2014MBL_MicDiv]
MPGCTFNKTSDAVVARYYQELLNFCWRSLRNREAAADLVQESYVRVLGAQSVPDGASREEHAIREPRALLYHTARNLLIDNHRRAALRQHDALDAMPEAAHPAAPSHLQPEQALQGSQDWQACVAAIDALPPRCRDAFVLHIFEELPHAQIAARMGISVSMVEKHIARGMLSCQAQLHSLREAT